MDRILIIEDDNELGAILSFYLKRDKRYDPVLVRSAEAALPLIRQGAFDAILLDIMLPGIDGMSFCSLLRHKIYCPIIFISCLDDEETIIKAMKLGGDDYLVKPFTAAMLLAYVEANIRRSRMAHGKQGKYSVGELVLNPSNHKVFKKGLELPLSPTEYEILYYLMQHVGEFVPFEELYEAVWGNTNYNAMRTLFTHVGNLRKKIEDDAKNPVYISTYQRNGYIFSKLD